MHRLFGLLILYSSIFATAGETSRIVTFPEHYQLVIDINAEEVPVSEMKGLGTFLSRISETFPIGLDLDDKAAVCVTISGTQPPWQQAWPLPKHVTVPEAEQFVRKVDKVRKTTTMQFCPAANTKFHQGYITVRRFVGNKDDERWRWEREASNLLNTIAKVPENKKAIANVLFRTFHEQPKKNTAAIRMISALYTSDIKHINEGSFAVLSAQLVDQLQGSVAGVYNTCAYNVSSSSCSYQNPSTCARERNITLVTGSDIWGICGISSKRKGSCERKMCEGECDRQNLTDLACLGTCGRGKRDMSRKGKKLQWLQYCKDSVCEADPCPPNVGLSLIISGLVLFIVCGIGLSIVWFLWIKKNPNVETDITGSVAKKADVIEKSQRSGKKAPKSISSKQLRKKRNLKM